MNSESPPSPENQEPVDSSQQPMTAPQRSSAQTSLGQLCQAMLLALLFTLFCLVSLLLTVNGCYDHVRGTLIALIVTPASAALMLALLYPLRKKETASLPTPKPRHWGCVWACLAPIVLFACLVSLLLLITGPGPSLMVLLVMTVYVVVFVWLNRFLVTSPNPRTRAIRLFIPDLPFVVTIGLFFAFMFWANYSESANLNKTVKTHRTADEVKKAWGGPLWSSEEAMIYATKKDQLVVVFLSKSWKINVRNDDWKPGEAEHTQETVTSPVPKVSRIAKLTDDGEFVDGYRILSGAFDSVNWIAYIESGTKLRVVDSAKASSKARERLDSLIRSGMLKEQIAKTPAIVEEDRLSDHP